MMELHHRGYSPLDSGFDETTVPEKPGLLQLAIRLANGVHQPFFTEETENLRAAISTLRRSTPADLPEIVLLHLQKFQVYYTFYDILHPRHRRDVEKLLLMTADPVSRLHVVSE
ncbi:MAG TPA: hypothetical protein VMW43_04155 [Bacteroidota bacterium]|nr:hypothetical protein [Bacteroidota bacterium]